MKKTQLSETLLTLSKIFLASSVFCLAMYVYAVCLERAPRRYIRIYDLVGILGMALLILSSLCFDVAGVNPASSHSVSSLLKHYLLARMWKIQSGRFCSKLLKESRNIQTQQLNILKEIMQTNATTMYGQRHGFTNIKSYNDYKNMHPVSSYEQFRVYIEKIAETGAGNVLTKEEPFGFVLTSGSTGKSKLIPYTKHALNSNSCLHFSNFHSFRKGLKVNLCKILLMRMKPIVRETLGGLKVATSVYFLYKHLENAPFYPYRKDIFDIGKEDSAFYVQAVLGLGEKEIGNIRFTFASQLLDFWNFVVTNSVKICKDIQKGKISEDIDLPTKIRESLNRDLKPNAKRARDVMVETEKGSDGLALRLWPYLRSVSAIATGSMKVYGDKLRKTYLKGVPLLTFAHVGSEALYGLNISTDMDDESYLLFVKDTFFEFIHEKSWGEQNPETLLAHELSIGELYEIVITTKMGLYRYRSGDIIKIIKYEQQCPVYEFRYRLGHTLNVRYERTPENILQESVLEAVMDLKGNVVDFTATEDVNYYDFEDLKRKARGYILLIEFEDNKKLSDSQLEKFDKYLCEKVEVYRDLRRNKSIAQMEVMQVAPGTFHLLHVAMNPNQSSQFKMPRVLRNKEYLSILRQHIL